MAADGVATSQIAATVGVTPVTVRAWRTRFAQEGLAKFSVVREGRGRKPGISPEQIEEIVRLTQHEKPSGATHRRRLWLGLSSPGHPVVIPSSSGRAGVQRWVVRDAVVGDDGRPLKIHRSRIRTTHQGMRDKRCSPGPGLPAADLRPRAERHRHRWRVADQDPGTTRTQAWMPAGPTCRGRYRWLIQPCHVEAPIVASGSVTGQRSSRGA
jgi:hypothetical protein